MESPYVAADDPRRTVLAVTVVALFVAAVFFVPWRVQPHERLAWAPAYRPPVRPEHSFETGRGTTGYAYEDGHVAWGLYALEVLGIVALGGVVYLMVGRGEEE